LLRQIRAEAEVASAFETAEAEVAERDLSVCDRITGLAS